MLSFLLDEHVSPSVAAIISKLRPDIPVLALLHWENGCWIGESDKEILVAAAAVGLTLLTYDRRTMPTLLRRLATSDEPHSGVIFVDELTIPPNDVPVLARSLIRFWDEHRDWDWSNRLAFLRRRAGRRGIRVAVSV